jgi:glutamate formiminotransferase
VAKVDVHETSKRGHKNRHYVLKDISEKEFNKLHEHLNEEKWSEFFAIINKFSS